MNIKHSLLITSLTLALASHAHASVNSPAPQAEPTTTEEAQAPSKRTDRRRLFRAGGIGCATGAIAGLFTGDKKSALRGCAIGAAVGGFASWQAQLKEAREVEAAAKAAGMKAEVHTEDATDEEGNSGPKLQSLVIDYEASQMQSMGTDTQAMLDRLAGLTTRAKNELTIRFEGTTACAVPLAELNRRGALERHTVIDACGSGSHRIVISPIPDVR